VRKDELNMKILFAIILIIMISFCSIKEQGDVALKGEWKLWNPTLMR
tara:strand:+ start:113 stop:253 length:141 start_codon:yes stop_codon:yes gene_type:complete